MENLENLQTSQKYKYTIDPWGNVQLVQDYKDDMEYGC